MTAEFNSVDVCREPIAGVVRLVCSGDGCLVKWEKHSAAFPVAEDVAERCMQTGKYPAHGMWALCDYCDYAVRLPEDASKWKRDDFLWETEDHRRAKAEAQGMMAFESVDVYDDVTSGLVRLVCRGLDCPRANCKCLAVIAMTDGEARSYVDGTRRARGIWAACSYCDNTARLPENPSKWKWKGKPSA